MSGDVTYQALERLTHMPDRQDPQADRIAGQYYYDVEFTGGTIEGVDIIDPVISGVDHITFDNGGSLRTGTADADTFLLQAYDVNDAVYRTFATLIAGNVPTMDLDASVTKNGSAIATAANNLGFFSATTSAQLAGVISDETGSGSLVFANTPTLVTPVLGAATATSVNGLTIDTTTGVLDITNGVTLAVTGNSTVNGTFSGTSSGTNTGDQTTSGTTNRITVANGSTSPVVDIAATYVGQSSITTLGTISTGVWNGTIIAPAYGGTGVNNGSNTVTLGGNLATSGAFNTTLTVTNTTNVTLPTTGTLSTLAGAENLTNKTITSADIDGGTLDNCVIGGTTPASITGTRYFTGTQSVADDTAISFTSVPISALMFFNFGTNTTRTGVGSVAYSAGTPIISINEGTAFDFNTTTGTLTGTTGVDGQCTVRANSDGLIYMENRSGATQTVKWVVLG